MKTLLYLWVVATAAHADSLKTADLDKLRDPANRDAEVARLSELNSDNYKITQCLFLTAKQRDNAPPLYLLSVANEYQAKRFNSDGAYEVDKPEELFKIVSATVPFSSEPNLSPVRDSSLMVFNTMGKEVRPFGGNNYIENGYFSDFNHDGILDRADYENCSMPEAPGNSVQVFTLQTVEPKPQTLLQVIFNWHSSSASDENNWAFTCFDDNHDGFVEIAFGPASAITPEQQRKFVFRWDAVRLCYSAGDIPRRSHIRVIKPGETLASIAHDGALGYSVMDGKSQSKSKENTLPSPPPAPYVFHSLKDCPDADLAAFFHGETNRDLNSEPKDSVASNIPNSIWNLTPKQAAIAIADANRTASHREKWQLVLDDRKGLVPPASGSFTHDWGSSSCYSYSSHFFNLRFGVPDPVLIVFEYNSIGVVGRNPLADQPAHSVRVIKLKDKEAKFIADTIFWLDRIRTYTPNKVDNLGMQRSCTADGHAKVALYPDHGTPRVLANETVWATSSISGNWLDDYNQTVFVNLAEIFLTEGVAKMLGERWNVAPEIGFQNLATPTDIRLAPRVDDDARLQLAGSYQAILRHHANDAIPSEALCELISGAGEEALTALRPQFEEMLAALPKENEEDQEYAALEKRFLHESPSALLEKRSTEEKTAYARYRYLTEMRTFLPSAILRKPLADAITKLRLIENTTELANLAAENGPQSYWALGQLRRTDIETWAGVVASGFRKNDVKNRRNIIATLAVARPEEVKHLIKDLSSDEYRNLIIEIASYHQKNDPSFIAKDIPVLMSLVREHKDDFIRRGEAIALLSGLEISNEVRNEFISILEKEIHNPQLGEYQMDTLRETVRALVKVAPDADHLELILKTPAVGYREFSTGIEALLSMLGNRPDRAQILANYIRPRFTESKGMMNEVFQYALAFDLRDLAPEIAAFATPDTWVEDGSGANYSGGHFETPVGQRYHIAREITALWQERDPATVSRMWVYFVASHSSELNPQNANDPMRKALCDMAASNIKRLPIDQRRNAVRSALAHIPIPAYAAETGKWLRELSDQDNADK